MNFHINVAYKLAMLSEREERISHVVRKGERKQHTPLSKIT